MARARANMAAILQGHRRQPAAAGEAKPKRASPRALESKEGRALVKWADLEVSTGNRPELAFLRHIPNSEVRGADAKTRAMRGGLLKAEGVRSGTWDYVLPVVSRFALHDDWQGTGESSMRYPGLWIELKIESERGHKNGGLSDAQVEFGKHLHAQGYACVVAYNWGEARDAIIAYLDLETVPHLWRPLGRS